MTTSSNFPIPLAKNRKEVQFTNFPDYYEEFRFPLVLWRKVAKPWSKHHFHKRRYAHASKAFLRFLFMKIHEDNESRYIALFVISRFIKKPFSTDDVMHVYLFSIFLFDRFYTLEKCGVTPHCLSWLININVICECIISN